MIGSFLSTWIKLRRRALLLGVLAAAAGVAALITSLVFSNSAPSDAPAGGPALGIPLSQLAGSGGLLAALGSAASVLGVFALAVAAGTLGADSATGTLRNLLIRQPRRLRLLAGQWLALVSFTAVTVAVAGVATALTAVATAGGQGIDTGVWFTADGWGASLRTLLEVFAATAGYATLGAALGVLLRAPVAAVSAGLAWLLALELIVAGTVDGADRWLPGQLLSAVARGGTDTVALGTAVATVVAYLAVAGAGAATAFTRRDVTA